MEYQRTISIKFAMVAPLLRATHHSRCTSAQVAMLLTHPALLRIQSQSREGHRTKVWSSTQDQAHDFADSAMLYSLR
jgi:hypothetical protein